MLENYAYDNGTPYWKDYGSSKNTFTIRITIISTKEEIYQSDCKICTPAVSWMNFHGTAVYICISHMESSNQFWNYEFWIFLYSISFTSYKQPKRILNFCNEFLFTYFVSKYWHDKSFKLRPKYIKKMAIQLFTHTKKPLCNTFILEAQILLLTLVENFNFKPIHFLEW